VHLETRTKKLARTVLLSSAGSVAIVTLVVALAARQNSALRQAASFPVYTYQNPFSQPDNPSPAALSEANAGGPLGKLLSVRWFAGLSGLGTLWLGASCYLYGGQRKRKRTQRPIESATKNQAKMNPLATVPAKPVIFVRKEDTMRPTILPRPTKRNRFVHRQITAPCQSRFRPIALVSSQTRFGRLK
jgi:hypothetical protein